MNDGIVELPPLPPSKLAPPTPRLRIHHFFIASTTAGFYLAFHRFQSVQYDGSLAIPMPFLAIFTVQVSMAAVLATMFAYDKSIDRDWNPAVELAIQTVWWNPVMWLTCMQAMIHLEDWSTSGWLNPFAVSAVWLMFFGVPTSVFAAIQARQAAWKFAYSARAVQALSGGFFPVFPSLAFLVVLLFCILGDSGRRRYGWAHRVAIGLVVVEQIAAVSWFVMCLAPRLV